MLICKNCNSTDLMISKTGCVPRHISLVTEEEINEILEGDIHSYCANCGKDLTTIEAPMRLSVLVVEHEEEFVSPDGTIAQFKLSPTDGDMKILHETSRITSMVLGSIGNLRKNHDN